MSTKTMTCAHIACESIGTDKPELVVIEFLSPEICSPVHAREFGAQLDSLSRPDVPQNFVIDFTNVRSIGSTAFCEIADFVRGVRSRSVLSSRPHTAPRGVAHRSR